MEGYDGTLIHLAFSISERESYVNPVKYIDNNIRNLALLIKNNNFDEIIFPSSAAVYNEEGKVEPSSVYGITKLACELLIKIYFKRYWILRIANPMGPGDKKTVFGKLAYCKLNNDVFTIYNDLAIIRDFFPVDLIGVTIKNILQDQIPPGLYNVGSGKKCHVVSMLRLLCKEHKIEYVIADPPHGTSNGYVATDNIIKCDDFDIEEEWLKYLA